jgi:hypothetical protein
MKLCNGGFQRYCMLVVARDVPSASSTRAVSFQSLVHGLQHLRVAPHAEIVVGAPNGHLLLLGSHVSARKFLSEAINVVEVAVRFILVLLVKFIVIKAFVVKVRSLWGRRDRGMGVRSGRDLLMSRRERYCSMRSQ